MSLQDTLNIVYVRTLFKVETPTKCYDGLTVKLIGGKTKQIVCFKAYCYYHWRRYSQKLAITINRNKLKGYFHYIATVPVDKSIKTHTFQRLIKKWLEKQTPTDGNLTWFYVRHNDNGDENRHYIIQSSHPINSEAARDNLRDLFIDAKGVYDTTQEIWHKPMGSWEGYVNYIVGLREDDKRLLPPWRGLKSKPYFAKPRNSSQ